MCVCVCMYPCTLKRSLKNVPVGPCKPSCASAWIPAEPAPRGRCGARLAAEAAPEQGGVASKALAASCLSVSCQQLPLAASCRNWREGGDVPGRAQRPTEVHGTAHVCTLHPVLGDCPSLRERISHPKQGRNHSGTSHRNRNCVVSH